MEDTYHALTLIICAIALFAQLFILVMGMFYAWQNIWKEIKTIPGTIIREFKTNKYFFF